VILAGRRVFGVVAALRASTELPEAKVRDLRRVLGEHAWLTDDELAIVRWAATRSAAPAGDVLRHAVPARVVAAETAARKAGWYPPGCAPRPPDPQAPPATAWEGYGNAAAHLDDALAGGGSGAWFWRPLPGDDVGTRIAHMVRTTLATGRDAIVVVPSPHSAVADAVVAATGALAVDVRGGVGQHRGYTAWLRARCGVARVVVGERRVAFWPVDRLGLAVVVDEANPALKERRSPRHHARDVLLERARRADAVAVLVGTVPSAPAWRLLREGRVTPIVPVRARERALAPTVVVDDRSDPRSTGRLGSPAMAALRSAVGAGQLAIVLAARRGEGRAFVCVRCGEALVCPTCASSLVRADGGVACEGCGWDHERAACAHCGAGTFAPLAAGAARLGDELARSFPTTTVAVVEGFDGVIPPPPAIVVMTRGSVHDEPPGPVGAVVLPDIDGQLGRPMLDAAEDALRLSMRVASWTSGRPGATVVVQTRDASAPAVRALVAWDPGAFWRTEASRRRELRYPPAGYAIRLDVLGDGERVATDLRAAVPVGDAVLGPRREADRAVLLIKCDDRVATVAALAELRSAWSRDGVAARVDVDPVDVG